MDEQLQTMPDEVQEPVEVVTVVDAQGALEAYAATTDARLTTIDDGIRDLGTMLATQSNEVSGVVQMDAQQWDDMVAYMDNVRSASSVNLYLALLTLCVLCAVLGTRIWSTISEGWRHG